MNNTSLNSADGSTHLKIVVVSLIAAIMVVSVGVAARSDFADAGSVIGTSRLEANGPVIRAGKPVALSGRETTVIR